ncbi:MAG: hypothetical protein ACLFP9_07000 [Desulfonatronovibrio sp.]
MRIFDQNSFEPSYLGMENPRVRKFKTRYRVGEVVSGIVLEYDAPRLAWVLVDDLRLLAWVNRDYFRGQRLHLMIENLHPEIVLKEVYLSDEEGGGLSIIV